MEDVRKNPKKEIYIHKNSEVSQIIFPTGYVKVFDECEYPLEEVYATFCGEFMFKREISDEDSWKYFVEIIQKRIKRSIKRD